MHSLWEEMSQNERAVFLNDHELHTKERFDHEKITLEQVNLSFFKDCKLVRAKIAPQEIFIEGGNSVTVKDFRRSYFLYKPRVRIGKDKIVPLENNSSSIRLAYSIFKPKLTKENIVEYVKFFGLIAEGKAEGEAEGEKRPFLFVDNEGEIPWSESVDSEAKARFIGSLSARSPHDLETGQFDVGLVEQEPFLLGKIYHLNCPAIYAGHPFSCEMTVAADGAIRMNDDHHIPFDGIAPTHLEDPYYVVQPTIELVKHLEFRAKIARLSVVPIFLIYVVLLVAALFSAIGSLAVFGDLTLGSLWPESSIWINNALLSSRWLLSMVLAGSCVALLFQIGQLLFLAFAEYHARHRPGWGDILVSQGREKFREKYPSLGTRFLGITNATAITIGSAILFWSVVLFSVQGLIGSTVDWELSDNILTLRSAAAFTVSETLGWAFRGGDPFGIRGLFESDFTLPSGLTDIGHAIRLTAFIITPLSVSAAVARIWRWSAPEKSSLETKFP